MKITRRRTTGLAILLVVVLCGCTKEATFESTVVDGRHKPIPGLMVFAHKTEPVQGYDTVVTITGADGRFILKNLCPLSDYAITFESGMGEINAAFGVQTGSAGTTKFVSPLQIRYLLLKNGVVRDSRTGLQWAPDPGVALSWKQSQAYVDNSRFGGHDDWRLPTRKELFDILAVFKPGEPAPFTVRKSPPSFSKINPFFNLGDCLVWTSEVSDVPVLLPPEMYDQFHAQMQNMVNVWQFSFCDGQYYIKGENKLIDDANRNRYVRILAVRSENAPVVK